MKNQFKLYQGDNIQSLKKLPDNSIDSVVTDPPYALTSIKKRFGKEGAAPAQYGTDGAFQRASKGFMGKEWDAEVPTVEFWKEVYRVLKPGGHILSFGGTRTYHRMVVNIEDAGFEIRDQIQWLYGSGFPKSHNIGKAVDKIQGNEREVVGEKLTGMARHKTTNTTKNEKFNGGQMMIENTKGTSEYEGWGTALKPAQEIIAVAQKPENLEGTALNLIYIIKNELWRLYVKIVESSSELNQAEQKEVLDTALCLVEKNTNIQDALQGLMDMSQLRLMENMSWNIVGLWNNILEDLYQKMSRYTTSTKSNLIIDLKTLKSLEWQNILENITQVRDNQTDGLNVNALTAVVLFNALNLKLKDIQQHSVKDNVIYKEDKKDCLNSPICLARKPLSEKSVAENVIKWGTGGINIDGCRISHNEPIKTIKAQEAENTIYNTGFGRYEDTTELKEEGRFPANIILDETAAEFLDEQSEGSSRYFLNIPEEKTYKKKKDICLNNNNCVLCAEITGWNMPQITELSVPTNVAGLPSNKLVHYVKSVLNLCEKQATYIVANLVAMETENMELQHIQDFTQDYKSYILIQNLVKSVEQMENIDITPTTQSLLKLFGSALRAIEKNISQDTKEKVEQKSEQYRFLYQAKVSKKERNLGLDGFEEKKKEFETTTRTNKETADKFGCERKGTAKNTHPTVKPINLMTYLCRLITPENGIVLDPFMGSGSTGIAALLEGFRFCGMEMDSDYFKIAESRIEAYEKYRELIK